MKKKHRHKNNTPKAAPEQRKGPRPFYKKEKRGDGARPPRKEGPSRIVGTLSKATNGWRLQSANRREKGEFILHVKEGEQLKEGDLALADISPSGPTKRFGPKDAKYIRSLGSLSSPFAVSLIAVATHDIPDVFSEAAEREAREAKPVTLEGRTDLRTIPLVTIDGADSRDFDDAVFAEAEGEGWHLIVAIADVAHYVKTKSALDDTAFERGNSVYFPDHVVPMLPEALSNELCSLKPLVERACMAVHLYIDKAGELTRWQFVRGLMRSAARLTYEQIEAAWKGTPDDITSPLMESVVKPLYGAYGCLKRARLHRGTLELELPERKVEIDQEGRVKAIKIRERLDSHKLIEEFMIAANVASAAQLELKGGVCLYRVHDRPTEVKLQTLRDFLQSLEINLVPGKQLHPRFLTKILEDHANGPHSQVINEMMLRTQAQATYSPKNIGHFGLALARYAHFTSPIRRYADLIVHRGLIKVCKLGNDGLTEDEVKTLEKIGEHLSVTERRAAAAEREAVDRFTTLFMADKVGEVFKGRISGVARFGLFARLDETGADGIILLQSLRDDYYVFDEKRQAFVGQRKHRVFQLAQPVMVRIEQADKLTGSMSFSIVDKESDAGEQKPGPETPPPLRTRNEKNRSRRHRSS